MSDRGPGATVRDGWIARRFVAVLTSGCVGVRRKRGSVVMEGRSVLGGVGLGSRRPGRSYRRVSGSIRGSRVGMGRGPFGVVLAVVVSVVLAVVVLAQGAGDCYVGLVVEPGGSCSYPGTDVEFRVDDSGSGRLLFFSSGQRIELRATSINGVEYTFVASRQSGGGWLIEEVGGSAATGPATTPTTAPPATVGGDSGAYTDVEGSVHQAAISVLADDGVFVGTECAPARFCPTDAVDRWVMAVWLVRILDGSDPGVGSSRFVDVDESQWWAPYVERLADLGVTAGCATEPARFCPYETVTRARMASFLVKAFDLPGAPSAGFADVEGGVHAANIDALAASRITSGCRTQPLSYCPSRDTTRAQMATFLVRALTAAALPGEGVDVIAGRAPWVEGYFQAELYKQLLEELGYNVSDPAEVELGPNYGYVAMARGEMDFWPNSRYPFHLVWLAVELPDGSLVGDHVTVVGEEMLAGGLEGFLVTKSFADEYGVYTMDELNSNTDALAAFDATDSAPGNGVADIFGCFEGWACDNIIENMIAFSGWDNIAQTTAGYDAMFAQAVDNVGDGVPMVMYTWGPSAYIVQLRPGDNVYWMGVDDILDDSNPANQEGGESHDQRGWDGSGGYAAIGADQCPSAADNPDGLCPIGWVVHDIQVTANNDFLAANPAAQALFEAVRLSAIDVSLANAAMGKGASPTDLATQWIADNRALADEWIAAALSPSTTDEANRPPRFTSPATLTAPEDSTAAGTVTAVDDDTADTVTGYAITGGADRSLFSITSTGQLNFNTAPDYEHPADTGGDNTYQIIVTATSGTGTRTNTATQTITVTITEPPSAPAPDLVVDTPTVNVSAPVAGARFALSVTVRNQGSGPSSSTMLRYYRSTDPTITTSDTAAGTDSVSGLDAQESGAESISVTAPPTPGTYYYGACVDSASGESDTTNNCSPAVTVTVGAAPAPDLVVDTPTEGKAVTGEIATCSGSRIHADSSLFNIVVAGTVTAHRSVSSVKVEAKVDDDTYFPDPGDPLWGSFLLRNYVGSETIGSMEAGDVRDFSIRGLLDDPSGKCVIQTTWEDSG